MNETVKPADEPCDPKAWTKELERAFGEDGPRALELAEQAVKEYPNEPHLLYLAAVAALVAERPERSLRFQKRLGKRYVADKHHHLLHALALAQEGRWVLAMELLQSNDLDNIYRAWRVFPTGSELYWWLQNWLDRIRVESARLQRARHAVKSKPAKQRKKAFPKLENSKEPEVGTVVPDLPRLEPDVPVRFELTEAAIPPGDGEAPAEDSAWFRLRAELAHLSLLQGFDELLCLPQLHGVETFWYQVETVRKVLKVFRGRVLLADEVGLGKTIEAGMVLKEYLLRGMVERFLILTPASLVGQWAEEMAGKFDVGCPTSYDPRLRSNPEVFWSQPRVIASIATARRQEHAEILTRQTYDLVIVDEAHHLKNRSTQNYKLVDRLQKRFLLLLSATPVQNSLVELYNLLTLLKPGIFATEKEFRAAYMTPGKPRVPANRERMRELMRDVMIRNTRALVDVRLPPRHAATLRLEAGGDEAACYRELNGLVREVHAEGPGRQRLALHHLLSAAGSSPAAAAAAVGRFADRRNEPCWHELHQRYAAIALGGKENALLELLERNPEEKKMVFVHHRETLLHLDRLLGERGIPFVRFEGGLSGPNKDAAIETFRERVSVLLSTESGGEGRNVQFCNTLINFDLPWNPMAIEQRIGRVHRIGQSREVFVFNLVSRDTLEDQVLRILDEKINMFELVVGEIDAILGELDEQQDFADVVFSTWIEATEQGRVSAFAELGERMADARRRYEAVKALDEELFGEDFETA